VLVGKRIGLWVATAADAELRRSSASPASCWRGTRAPRGCWSWPAYGTKGTWSRMTFLRGEWADVLLDGITRPEWRDERAYRDF
jgi:hypothetical protein